jgi:uncharacterized membrane protein YkgB
LRHSAETFVIVLVTFSFAIALTYVEDWAHATNRPLWLQYGLTAISILIFVADGIAIICNCASLIRQSIQDLNSPGE